MKEDCWYKEVCTNECTDSCVRYLEMSYLMDNSNIPKSRQFPKPLYPDDSDYTAFCMLSDIKQNMTGFVSSGSNLYIYSTHTGNGKTSWAIKLMLKYFDEVWAGNGFRVRGLFIHVPTFLTQLKNFNAHDDAIERIKKLLPTVDLVVWDDIASTDMSSYDYSQLLTYIDLRMLNEKSNIFTSNRGSDVEKSIGVKLASRIWNSSIIVEFIGGDKR